ncbi:hypothetical protein LEP1GSC021_4577 [Leptospira noguchii str. 1993005606]|nr:hypothetical protein LEP1GSC021_4577 [Leptospira noguchii str. 1993005606]
MRFYRRPSKMWELLQIKILQMTFENVGTLTKSFVFYEK